MPTNEETERHKLIIVEDTLELVELKKHLREVEERIKCLQKKEQENVK